MLLDPIINFTLDFSGFLAFIILITPKFSELVLGRVLAGTLEQHKRKLSESLENHKAKLQRDLQTENEYLKTELAKTLEDHKAQITSLQQKENRDYEELSSKKSALVKRLEKLISDVNEIMPKLGTNAFEAYKASDDFLTSYLTMLNHCQCINLVKAINEIKYITDAPDYWQMMDESPDRLSKAYRLLKREADSELQKFMDV
jgi:DNA repair exonuclease SbcCD ATPase subunit